MSADETINQVAVEDVHEGGNGAAAQAEEPITIVITFMRSTANIQVTGPLHNPLLMYGLLELTKDSVKQFQESARAQAAAKEIVPAFSIPRDLRGKGLRG